MLFCKMMMLHVQWLRSVFSHWRTNHHSLLSYSAVFRQRFVHFNFVSFFCNIVLFLFQICPFCITLNLYKFIYASTFTYYVHMTGLYCVGSVVLCDGVRQRWRPYVPHTEGGQI